MSSVSFGDLALPSLLQRQNAGLKDQMQRLTSELTTGVAQDSGRKLGGDFSRLAGLERSLAALDAYGKSSAMAALYIQMQQNSLQAIGSSASALGSSLLQAGSAGGQPQIGVVASQGADALSTALSQLNVRAGGRSLFAGAATDGAAAADGATVLAALTTAVAGQVTASGVETAVRDWFASPSGYAVVGYVGSGSASAIPVGDGQSADVSTTALDPAIVDALTGFALAAMIGSPGLAGDTTQQADLAAAAGEALMTGASQITDLESRIGVVQARVSAAQARNSAEQSGLEAARANLLSIDQYQTAGELQETQTQIQTLYALTARLSGLSLVNFLR